MTAAAVLRSERPQRGLSAGATRIYVTKRSWLDAGTEVLPGERKFQDYAFPPAIGYPSFGAKTATARSTASRSTRHRISAVIRKGSR